MRTSYAQSQIPARGRDAVPYPDWRTFIDGVMLRAAETRSGTVTGTGAAIEVALDFDPAEVSLYKMTGTGAPITMDKHPGMGDDDTLKTIANGTRTLDAAGGVTLGTVGQKKFTIGTDADINEAGVAILWTARGYSPTGGL